MNDSVCCVCGACFPSDLPGSCPYCGSTKILGLLPGGGDPFAVIESAQRCGLWDRAFDLLSSYLKDGVVSTADYNLISAQIQWRADCVARMEELRDTLRGDDLRRVLYSEFDSYAANWSIDVYKRCF